MFVFKFVTTLWALFIQLVATGFAIGFAVAEVFVFLHSG